MLAATTTTKQRSNILRPPNIAAAAAAAANAQIPAYPGARFNSSGFCTNHSNVRLCTVTDEGKYKILRKVCFKCGSTSLRNNTTRRVITLHGIVKKDIATRALPKGLFSGTVSSDGDSGSAGDARKDQSLATSRRTRGDRNSKSTKKPPSCSEVMIQRKKTRESNTKKKDVISTKKDRNSRSTEDPTTLPSQGSTRRSRSLSTARTTTSLSLSELSGLHPPPSGKPTSGRSRSKSRSRKTNTTINNSAAASKSTGKSDSNFKDNNNRKKPVRSTLINMTSSKSVEAKVKEITKSKTTHGKAVDYTELGKLITMKDDENTLPTLSCPSTPESFKSKQAVFSMDATTSGLIVELYNKKESEVETYSFHAETKPSSNRRRNEKISKLKPRSLTRKAL